MNDNLLLSQDALEFLNIKECFFITDSFEQIIFRPIYMEVDKWIVTAASCLSSFGTVRIVFLEKQFEFLCASEPIKIENFSSCYMIIFKEKLPENILIKLMQVKKTFRSSSRRSEERFEIGISKHKKFGFNSPVQYFLFNERKMQCFVNNVSVHGAMITTENFEAKTGERIKLLFSFENPLEKISQVALVVNRNFISSGFLRLSLNFIEPISFLWQKRICSFAEKN